MGSYKLSEEDEKPPRKPAKLEEEPEIEYFKDPFPRPPAKPAHHESWVASLRETHGLTPRQAATEAKEEARRVNSRSEFQKTAEDLAKYGEEKYKDVKQGFEFFKLLLGKR